LQKPTETEPRGVKLEAKIQSQRITASSEFIKKILKVKNKFFALKVLDLAQEK
jgi:hypothetical protein